MKRIQDMQTGNCRTGDFSFPKKLKKPKQHCNLAEKNVKNISRYLQVNKLWGKKIILEGKTCGIPKYHGLEQFLGEDLHKQNQNKNQSSV